MDKRASRHFLFGGTCRCDDFILLAAPEAYVYVKSPIASNGNGRNTPPFGAFYFRGADQLPATPFVGNYRR